MKTMRKGNDEIYQLAKDQALVKKLKNKRFRLFCLCPPDVFKDIKERVFGSVSYKHYSNVCNSRIQKLSFLSLILKRIKEIKERVFGYFFRCLYLCISQLEFMILYHILLPDVHASMVVDF